MAGVAVLLQAEPERPPPEVALVVVRAAGIEAQVAAQGAGVAELGARHVGRRVGQRRRPLTDQRMPGDRGERLSGPHLHRAVPELDPS